MKKYIKKYNKLFKRCISFVLVVTLIFTGTPVDIISNEIDEIIEQAGIAMTVKAAELNELTEKYTGNSFTFTSGAPELSEYSQCFQDAVWAAAHANDSITLNSGDGKYIFDANYNPIGSENAPFNGTILLNTTIDEYAINTNTPIFNYVKDSVNIVRIGDNKKIALNINRVSNVGSAISPLFAVHVVGSNAAVPYEWKITLNSANACSYSGVIFEMTQGAKINLTFKDESNHAALKDPNGNIDRGSIINNNESNKNYGILCGQINNGSVLKATYTKTNDDNVTFIGTGTAYCGGLIGEINGSTFELLSGSSSTKVDFQTPKDHVGFICGHAENSSIILPTGYTFSGTVDGNQYAGGIAGYCKNTVVDYAFSEGMITLAGCNIKNGTTTGGVFGYYECDNAANDILLNRTYILTNCKVEGTGLSGGIAGEYKPVYTTDIQIDLNKFSLDNTTELKTGDTAGGLFGKFTAAGNVTITDTDTATVFIPPTSSVKFGGVIGEYVNNDYAHTLTLNGFTVKGLNNTSDKIVGGIIGILSGSTYVSVSSVNVTDVIANSATYFGGIISTLDNNNAGSFIDVTGNFTLSMGSGTYKGGAIAGSFKRGVIRLAGVTDISGARAENGYAQLVYENDETLVYAKGSGSDADWTLKRNPATTASDLGQWGEVLRMFGGQNAEGAGIVSVANNKVTVAQGVTAITDTVSFAKCALNMQLNDGSDHGALCFADKTTYPKSVLLGSALTVSGTIDLSGTGLLGLMRDGGNGKYYNVNNNQNNSAMNGNPDYFTKTITGTNAEIKLAVGESYGTGNTNGGKIYLSHNNGHSAQGLLSFANGATISDITVSGTMNVERVENAGDALHMGAVMGYMTNGASLTNVSVNTQMDFTRSHQNGKIYIGGVAGLFDGDGTGKLIINGASSSVSPTITLHGSQAAYSEDSYDNRNSYTGGVLGLLGGKTTSKYDVEIANTDVSPTITLDNNVANTDHSYLGGMIGRVRSNTTNERSIELDTVTMTGASVETKSKYAGGLLGSHWERTNLTVDGLTITDSTVAHKYSGTDSKQSGLVFKATGKWDINSLSISSSSFTSVDAKPASFGMIVNEAYSNDDGLYINLKNSGYSLTGVTVPTSSSDGKFYVDEIAADTKNNGKDDGDIMVGGSGTGIININMNVDNGSKTKIVDGSDGTGTYQNRLYEQLGDLVGNQNSRYYYNLDVMLAKGNKGNTAPGGEQFLLWSVYNYAASNIRGNFKADDNMITATDINLSGLSYYPIAGGDITMPASATVTFGFNAIDNYEDTTGTPDGWSRNPDDNGGPNTANARNQHYLMQTGLFTTVSKFETQTALTLTGDFGYVKDAASGALINKSTSGTVTLTGLKLNGLKPSSADSYMLINSIDGTGTATPTLTVSNLRAENYASETTQPVAKSLFGSATGQNMTMTFSDIKLDARDGEEITDPKWTKGQNSAESAMDTAYGTSRSIFSTATIFTELWAAKTCNMEYNYAVEKDWNTETGPREVTYGKEVTDSREYPGGEKRYFLAGDADGNYTNPVSNSGLEFDFSAGFLPYVGNYTDKGKNTTYPVTEIKVNYKAPGITVGCGTYNDPYIISSAAQLVTVAKTINGDSSGYPSVIRLPNVYNADHVITSWHGEAGDGLYNHSGTSYSRTNTTTGIKSWNETRVRYYLASAYYKIEGTFTLPNDFPGIGVPNDSANTYKGNTVFHGVIVGDKTSKPTITIPNGNPLIVVANGAVVKNIDIKVTGNVTRTQTETGNYALYGYNGTNTDAQYYGGVIGEIMGGDNIIDDVKVTYSGTTTLDGSAKHLIAEGGMVGAVVNGALIFRGTNSVSGRSVTGGGIYSNQFVGRVINGYAIYEKISTRTKATDVAPDNYNTCVVDEEDESKVTKTYTYSIDTIDRSNTNKLDVNYTSSGTGTITVPDAQSLYIMSLITQSIASTAKTSGNEEYDKYSPSYGYNTDTSNNSRDKYLTGVARLGDYSSVGCGTGAEQPNDYSSYASLDSVNNYTNSSSKDGLMKAPVPYIIYRYTERKSTNATNPAADFPARKMTSDNTKFWDITLSKSNTFASMDSFQAFRGIGSVGINAYSLYGTVNATKTAFKVATFNGNKNTINLHISLPRYRRDQENYFHAQNKSLTQSYSGDELSSPYGHDENMVKLLGLGLFDCVIVNNDESHEYQFQNFTLQGTIEDKVYDSSGNDITGKKTLDANNKETTGQTQLFCVGGVVGKRVNGNNSDLNFQNITFDGLTITGAYNCGGLIGIDAIGKNGKTGDSNAKKIMKIDGCNSTTNGISVTGGYFGGDSNIRHGVGSFVGMTFWCRPYIDGDNSSTDEIETPNIYVSNVNTFYDGDYGCSVGGLIGYTGSGAEIKNINLVAANSSAVIGGEKASNAAGFIGFTQAMTSETTTRSTPNANDLKDCVYIENCKIQNLPIKAKNSAAGFVSKTGNSDSWHTKYIYISECAVIGDSENKPEIKAYGTGKTIKTNCVGGFVGDLRSSVVTCLVQNSYIENYTIEGWHVGGIIGETTYRSVNLRNLYVKDCEIIRNQKDSGAMGGIVGYSDQNINGYNLKIDNVIFKKKNGSSYPESPGDSGFILGANDGNNTRTDKFIAIGAYYTDHPEKVPAKVVGGSNNPKNDSFFVFADYLNASADDITAKRGYASTFGVTGDNTVADTANNIPYPSAPFVNVAPHMEIGIEEYITGDGASINIAGMIYKDAKEGSSNRQYTIGNTNDESTNTKDEDILAKYINADGTYNTSGAFKISTSVAEFGPIEGVDNFTMLVINDDSAKANDITPFIKSYIRLVTNAAGQPNQYKFSPYAYSCGNDDIDKLYQVVINPCYYDEAKGKFVLGESGDQGLQLYGKNDTKPGEYWLDSTKADSASENKHQFSLIDVQFKDPTDSAKIAYHLYVPVYTKKLLSVDFSAVSMSETKYYRNDYAGRIKSELASGKSSGNPSQLVESTDEWTTTFIRFTYPKNQISVSDEWNFEKSITLNLDGNFKTLPIGTKLILVDPNANVDKYYTLTINEEYPTNNKITLELSSFVDEESESGAHFAPQKLSEILKDPDAENNNELYEDYYISMYVPKKEGETHSISIGCNSEMSDESGENKANIVPKLFSRVVLGDLFIHKIIKENFEVKSGDGIDYPDNEEMTAANNVLKTHVEATVQIKDISAASYLVASSNVYHSFFITLTSHDADHKVSDIIYGINPGNISNTTTYSYDNSTGHNEQTITTSSLEPHYIELDTGNIMNALYDSKGLPVVTIISDTIMEFYDVTAFPYNVDKKQGIGTQVSVKSSLAYREADLPFSALNVLEGDPQSKYYYSTSQNTAELSFNAVPADDVTDEIGLKTNNRSLLGVNGKYGNSHPIYGKAIYNVDKIVDYDSANAVIYKISLHKKVTDGAYTSYVKVNDISKYLQNVNLDDHELTLTRDTADKSEYVFTGAIDHKIQADLDKLFEVDFGCDVITGEGFAEYANYKIMLTAELYGAKNSYKESYIVYTNAKFDPSVID